MARSDAVTVCVVAGEDRRRTRAFLSALAGELAPHDNVLLTGLGRPPATEPAAWRLPGPRGILRPATGGQAPRLRPVVIFVEDLVEPSPGWIEVLAGALADAGVAAVAPRTNAADGEELFLGVPYRPSEAGVRKSFSRDLARERRDDLSIVGRLRGPCLAVRRDAIERVGGIAAVLSLGFEPHSLTRSATLAGGALAVAEGAYLHHHGGASLRPDPRDAGYPFLSACLIVRDEEEELPRCLASIEGIADEVVVYDTGSTDRTLEIARAAGCRVVEGYWDDDFARARNDALAYCRGQWILWLDADESLCCEDPSGFRSSLLSEPAAREAFVVLIENLNGTEAGSTFTHPACRLFRRACGHWEGHLHELVRARRGTGELEREMTSAVRIFHRGYLQSHIAGRAKATRNLRTAFGDLAGGSNLEWGFRLSNLGRSYALLGQHEEALEHCRRAVESTAEASVQRLALRTIVHALNALGRHEEALEEIERLRRISIDDTLADSLAGGTYLALGRHEDALAAFDRVGSSIDEDGFEYSPAFVATGKAEALRELGRPAEAADALLLSIVETGGIDAHLGTLIEAMDEAGRDLAEILDAMPRARIGAFVPQLLQLKPEVADRALEAWWRRDAQELSFLAAAGRVAPRLEITRQLVWSSRLRAVGLPVGCPLVATASSSDRPARERVLASAVAWAMFSDPRARMCFAAASLSLPAPSQAEVEGECAAIAPGLVPVMRSLLEPGTRGEEALQGPRGAASQTGRRVLVVDRRHSALRTTALAALLARLGHEVTLAEPLPVESSAALLGRLGVTVRGWADPGPGQPWRPACESALALLAAETPFDVVVLERSAVEALPALRRVLWLARLVVDLGSGSAPDADLSAADLLLAVTPGVPAGGSLPAVALDIPLDAVLGPSPLPPAEARYGCCVVGTLRDTGEGAPASALGEIRPGLEALAAGEPFALLGDDPSGALAAALPEACVAGNPADPRPWLAASRLVLVMDGPGAEDWLAAARACGTPACVLPSEPEAALVRLQALGPLRDGGASRPSGGPRSDHFLPADPLAGLPRRARSQPVPRASGSRPEVRFVGGVFGLESLAQVNRELLTRLARRRTGFELTAVTSEPGPHSPDAVEALRSVRVLRSAPPSPADVEVRHQWPPDFSPVRRGRLVLIQPWEFGGLPAEWLGPLRDVVDELWVPSRWVRDCAVRSGVAAEMVHVVPNGVDVDRFRPEGPPYRLRTKKGTKLLFVGGMIQRKGVDALLEAYLSTFDRSDDVCLVIKPFGSASVYSNQSLEREVRQAAAGSAAEIELVDGDLGFEDMAALYRSCDALVHPYRGEGFGLPIAEALASGLPVIVPDGGACLDFCDDDDAWLVRAREVPIRPGGWTPSPPGTWWLEPSRRELSAAMRAVVEEPERAKAKGAEGRRRIVEGFSWDAAADCAARRIEDLLGVPSPSGPRGTAPGTPREADR